MHIGLVIFVSIVIILWVIIRSKSQNDNKDKYHENNGNQKVPKIDDQKNEIEEIFYEEVQKGSKTYKLMAVFDQFDLIFIKSLFQSEQIPYYIESEHISNIKPGMGLGSFGNVDFYILEKDYNNAIKVISEYRKIKKKNISINKL